MCNCLAEAEPAIGTCPTLSDARGDCRAVSIESLTDVNTSASTEDRSRGPNRKCVRIGRQSKSTSGHSPASAWSPRPPRCNSSPLPRRQQQIRGHSPQFQLPGEEQHRVAGHAPGSQARSRALDWQVVTMLRSTDGVAQAVDPGLGRDLAPELRSGCRDCEAAVEDRIRGLGVRLNCSESVEITSWHARYRFPCHH